MLAALHPSLPTQKAVPLNPLLKEDPNSPVYVFGSGVYLESGVEDGGGGCAIVAAGAESAPEGTVFNLFLVVSRPFFGNLVQKTFRLENTEKIRLAVKHGRGFKNTERS